MTTEARRTLGGWTWFWESSWDTWLRVLLVCCFALAWSAMFFPRRTAR